MIFLVESGCNRKKVVVLWQIGFFVPKMVVFGQKWFSSGKVVVFGLK